MYIHKIISLQVHDIFSTTYELLKSTPKRLLDHTIEITTPDSHVHRISSRIPFPEAPGIAEHVSDAEAAIIPFCKQFGLYRFDQLEKAHAYTSQLENIDEKLSSETNLKEKETYITSAISNTGFGWLVGMVAPDLTPPEIIHVTLYFLTLFDHDDDADRAMSGGMNLTESENIGRAMLYAYQGNEKEIPENYKEHKRIKALLELHRNYFQQFQTHESMAVREEFNYSVYTLRDYLNSVQSERRHELLDSPIDIDSYLELRRHTGGIQHAIAIICLSYGVDFEKVRQRYIEFQYMIDVTAKAVGILNDYYSAATELKALYKKIIDDGDDPSREDVVKSRIQSNLLLLHWRNGLSLEEASVATLNEYSTQMNTFYTYKTSIHVEIKKNKELRRATFACEGWLFGHGPWGAFSGRYNSTSELQGSVNDVYTKVKAKPREDSFS